MAEYKIELGIKLNESDLNSIKSTIKGLETNGITIKIDSGSIKGDISSIVRQMQQTGSDAASSFAKGFDGNVASIKTTANNAANTIQHMRDVLAKAKFNNSSIDIVTKDLQEMSLEIQKVSTKINGNNLNVSIKGIDELGRVVTIVKEFDYESGNITSVGKTIAQSFDTSADAAKRFQKEVNNAFADVKNTRKEIGNLEIKLIDEKDAKKIDSINSRLSQLRTKVSDLKEVYGDYFSTRQNNILKSIDEDIDYRKKDAQIEFDNKTEIQATTTNFEKLKNLAKEITGLRVDIIQSDDVAEIGKATAELDRLNREYSELFTKTSGSLTSQQKSQLNNLVDRGDAKVLREFNDELNEFVRLQNQIENTRFEIGKLEITDGNENEIVELKRQLEELEQTYSHLMGTFMKKATANGDIIELNDFKGLENGIEEATRKAENRLEHFKSQIADARAEAARGIELDIKLGNYDNQMSQMHEKFNKLSSASTKLRESVAQVESAYREMELALEGTGDEVADRERLIQAEQKYAQALEKTNNLIRIQAREDKARADADKLANRKTALQLDMSNYLKENTRAANEFGDEIRRLSSLLNDVRLDDIGVTNVAQQYDILKKKIKDAGKDGLTVFDKLKSKAKEYMSYISAAEIFMWAEQGLREMFEAVKEIDTAMTGLYRVTDLTASQYDTLFNNMISSAKEYGATLNDIINATTDWVRAGFDANTALGLAEVTTMYQHISDLDYDTAAENLITAYNGFKNELNNLYSGDEVAAVNYIADIFNELDRQNCPQGTISVKD